MKKTGAQILCESLIAEGVDVMFGFPGGVLLPFYDTLPQYPQIRHILVRHEQGAAHAADGYARATGKVGVCMATSGPGATNLVTGIANAYLDSVPMVALTGQVVRAQIGKDAFQEIDISGITLPITKHSYVAMDAGALAGIVKEAFYIARSGRPGPVLIDLPKDVMTDQAEYVYPDKVELPGYKVPTHGHPTQLKSAAKLINEAKQPLIIAGRGVLISGASPQLKDFAEKAQIPVITTLLGISCFPEDHVLSYGMAGMHGTGYANKALENCDLLIAVGMRFDDRVTGKVNAFAPHAKIIHIDMDPAEIGKNVAVHVPIVGDVGAVLYAMEKIIETNRHIDWIRQLDEWRKQHPILDIHDSAALLPQHIIHELYEATRGDAIVVTGVGQHQMWAAQHYIFHEPNTFISSGGLGTMGFGLPAAMGAKVGCPDKMVWLIDGDGSFQMTIQELATLVQDNIAVKIAIMNNGFLGMVRQWQDLFYAKNYVATPISCPDFVKVAEAYCIAGIKVTRREEIRPAIEQAMNHDGPFLLNFMVEPEENVYPMVPPGAANIEFIERPKKEVSAWQRRSTR
ncbi:MAG: acetolactate synthase, large subunit, biosynthetic type [Chloroflexi bacterium RBG_13_51_18]|nr:MAG: acetolactate synthase, large subunit, biosynthetic type [Chloroflexi bacterium RBG_13_51_18]